MSFQIQSHILVPKHVKASEKEVEDLLEKYNITKFQLPKILKKDSALEEMEVEIGDVIKIMRKSPTLIKSIFYRVVI